jgi:hypothetical protein
MRLTLGTIVRAVGTSTTWPSPMKPFGKSTTMCAALARTQLVECCDAATTARNAFADRVEDADFMHGVVPG